MFRFLWNGKDKVTRRSPYAPYHSGGINMVDYENMVKALRLSWLQRLPVTRAPQRFFPI